jgi:hypothetical protein
MLRNSHSVTRKLGLAYCHRVHFRFQTHCRLPQPCLEALRRDEFQAIPTPYGLHLLDVASDEVDLFCQLSLRPEECVAACASKFKGRLSKWPRTAPGLDLPTKLLGAGYLACTLGAPTSRGIVGCTGRQGEHHGYSDRPLPPVFVAEYPLPPGDAVRLDAAHNVSLLRHLLVLGTMQRRGVFTQTEAAGVVAAWQGLQASEQFALLKVSFVPDHVPGAALVPASGERGSFWEVVLEGRSRSALKRLNPWISDDNPAKVVRDLTVVQAASLIEANQFIHESLVRCVSHDQDLGTGRKGQTVKVTDFGNPDSNEFLVVSQFRVQGPTEVIVLDLVIFVDGLPLAVIECKSRPFQRNPYTVHTGVAERRRGL